MQAQSKKLIAPVIITTIFAVYFVFAAITSLLNLELLIAKIIGIVIPLALMGVSIFVLVERIKEVRSGEEDDLSKY